jgi:Asp-tRNA(Asn)/Glu-tRNA(Gln) amidotransferase C subunit
LAYLQPSGGEPIPAEQIQSLASLFGLTIPSEDLESLTTALRDQLASVARLETLDLSGVIPSPSFDPRWHD